MTTKIGSHSLIMAYSHVAHDCIVGEHCILANAVNMAGHVVVDDFAIIGGMSAVHQFTRIGSHVMVSGGSLVRKDIPPFVKAGREPLSYVGVNSIGLRRRGFSNERINQIQDVYRVLYLSGLNTTKALQKIEAELPATPDRDEIMLFVQSARRGIMRGYGSEE
jgi:UDP-N-acetylglucosamine acyltransferase